MASTDRRRRLVVLLGGLVVAALIAAAMTWAGGGIETHGPVTSDERPWIVLTDSGNDALMSGQLELDDGCLLLSGQAVVWPSGTRWDAESSELTLRGGAVAHVGDTITGAGGSFGDDAWSRSDAGLATASCRPAGTAVWVFNRSEEPTVETAPA